MARKKIQRCVRCEAATGRCEDDAIYDDDDGGPFCEECGPDRHTVTVWGFEGAIVKKLWTASLNQVDAVLEQYADEPFMTVVVEEQ